MTTTSVDKPETFVAPIQVNELFDNTDSQAEQLMEQKRISRAPFMVSLTHNFDKIQNLNSSRTKTEILHKNSRNTLNTESSLNIKLISDLPPTIDEDMFD